MKEDSNAEKTSIRNFLFDVLGLGGSEKLGPRAKIYLMSSGISVLEILINQLSIFLLLVLVKSWWLNLFFEFYSFQKKQTDLAHHSIKDKGVVLTEN